MVKHDEADSGVLNDVFAALANPARRATRRARQRREQRQRAGGAARHVAQRVHEAHARAGIRELEFFEQDFCVGGRAESRFGPKGAANLYDVGTFLDIVPDRRIVGAGTMHKSGVRISLTLCTFEFTPERGGGTCPKLTDQSAFLDGRERPDERRQGWGKILERLAAHLQPAAAGHRP